MTHVLLVAGALIFETEWEQAGLGFVPDRLARRLTRARRTWQPLSARWSDGAAHLEWLARAFAVPGDPAIAAPYSWQTATGESRSESRSGDVWFCEPVHLSLEPERTVLTPIDAPPLTEAEGSELFLEAADAARGHGAVLRQAAGRWYLLPDESWNLWTMPLPAVLGASIEARLPQGAHALRWRQLLNEIQMRWHTNRVNRERESRRQQIANGLWLHGGGAWSALDASRFHEIHTDDPVVLGWKQAARADPGGRTQSDSLTLWPHLFEPYWRRDWHAWGARWAQLDLEIDALTRARAPARRFELVACGRQGAATFTLEGGAVLLPWRRRTLRQCLLESITR
jgi:hypothetical protein